VLSLAPVQTAAPAAATTAASSTSTSSFASALQDAGGTSPVTMTSPTTTGGGTSAGQAIVKIAEGEVGVAEQPPGSNDSPRIAQYRQATAGSGVGPWCAYFASWAARQAGVPIGDHGQGFGAVASVWSWAQQAHKALPAGSRPAAGDLILWGSRHIGIVESVDPNGTIHTIEGNSSDRVSKRTYGPDGGGATGYVRLG
jgi:CHAP domain-containing protein